VDVFDAITTTGHEQVVFGHDQATGLRAVIAVHDTTLGPSLGGVRMRPYATEDAALADVLRLSRAMTYKFATAGIDLGGGKSVIIGDPSTDKSDELLRAFGRFVRTLGGRYIPGIDVGTTQEDLRTIGLEADPVSCVGVDPSPFTALGAYAAIQGCLEHVTGTASAKGVRVAVQGVGHVGGALARYLAEDGADLVLADVDRPRAEQLAAELNASVVDADSIVAAPCDVFAPCAVGGVIDDATIPQLRCRIVAGGANNVLADVRHAEGLREAGITYAPDYVANAGGVVLLDVERAGVPTERARERCLALRERVRDILQQAEADGITTVEAADRVADARLERARTGRAASPRGPGASAGNRADVVRRYYEFVDARALDDMLALFADDVVYRRPGYDPLRGIGQLRTFYAEDRVIADGAHTLSSLSADADRVAVEGEFRGTLRDGREACVRFADFFVVRGGRITRRDTYFDAPLV
jgi:glutamate dehydrogenase/leucine dehydrogenase/ketosteroid isomerase-like protein